MSIPPLIEQIRLQASHSAHLQNCLIAGAAMEGGINAPFPRGDGGRSCGPYQIKTWIDGDPVFEGHPLSPAEAENPAIAVAYAIKYELGMMPDGRQVMVGLGYEKNSALSSDPIEVAYKSEHPAHYYSKAQQEAAYAAIQKYGHIAMPNTDVVIAQPPIKWVGCHPNNFLVGRGGISAEAVVWHVTTGGMPSSWFWDPAARASTNAAVSKLGLIEMYVRLPDTAFAHGSVEVAYVNARPLIQANWGYNPNLWAYSIEFEGTEEEVRLGIVPTAQQAKMAVWLTAYWFNQELWDPSVEARPPADRDHILMHRDISPNSRTCPVWGEDVQARMIGMVNGLLMPPTPTPEPEPEPTPTPTPEPEECPPMDDAWMLRVGLAEMSAKATRDLVDGDLSAQDALHFARQCMDQAVEIIDSISP